MKKTEITNPEWLAWLVQSRLLGHEYPENLSTFFAGEAESEHTHFECVHCETTLCFSCVGDDDQDSGWYNALNKVCGS